MGGFLSALGGAGQAAATYRDKHLEMWQQSRDHLANLISQARDQAIGDPNRYAQLSGLIGDVYTSMPGKSQKSQYQKFMDLTTVHPDNLAMIKANMPKQAPAPTSVTTPTPGNPATLSSVVQAQQQARLNQQGDTIDPEGTPGTNLVGDKSDTANGFGGMNPLARIIAQGTASVQPSPGMGPTPQPLPKPMPQPAAQAATNPISGGSSINLGPVQPGPTNAAASMPAPMTGAPMSAPMPTPDAAPPPAIAPVGMPAGGGDGAAAPISAPMDGHVFRDPREIYKEVLGPYLQAGFISPAQMALVKPQLENELAHNENLRQMEEAMQIGPRKLAMLKAAGIHVPDWQAAAIMTGTSLPPGMAGLIAPGNVPGMLHGSDAPPGTMDALGHPINPTGVYRVQYNKMTGQPEAWYPNADTNAFQTDANGNLVGVGRHGAAGPTGNVTPSLITPKTVNLSNGGQGLVSAEDVRNGRAPTPIPGAINNSAISSVGSSYTDPSGHASHSTSKVLPNVGGVGGAARTAIPSVGGAGGAGSGARSLPASSVVRTTNSPASPTGPVVSAKEMGPVTRPFNPSDPIDGKVLDIANDAANARELTNAADKAQVYARMHELGLSPGNLASGMRESANRARLVLTHLNDISGVIDQAEKDGDLGLVASRWNDFLTNKIGEDPTKGQVFSKLASNREFLASAVAMAHGGLRGGSSPPMIEHWEQTLYAKDPATLRSKLSVAKQWMQGYASMDKQGTSKLQDNGALPKPVDNSPKTYEQYKVGPNGHKIGWSTGMANWVDAQTGAVVK